MTLRGGLVLALVLGCGSAPVGMTPATETHSESTSVGGSTELDESGSTSSGGSSTSTTTSTEGPSTESSSGSDPLPPAEIACDDDLDDDGDARTDCFDDDCWNDAVCTERFVRVATWNVRGIGAPGTPEHEALLLVLARIDADIVCLQEVGDDEAAALEAVREAAGYGFAVAVPPTGGMIRNACLSRYAIAQWDELWASDLSSDPSADDLTRAILRLRIRIEAVDRWVTVLATHLKADTTDTDRFRRMVDAVRLGGAIGLERETYPDNAIVVVGDFNEQPEHPRMVFDAPPSDLPFAYSLGDDIALPLPYTPFAPIENEGLERVDARVEDTAFRDTYLPGLVRLDYIYEDAGEVVVSEVYEACEDDGVDGALQGDRMPKAGDPLPCGTNGDASDHRPVIAQLYFE